MWEGCRQRALAVAMLFAFVVPSPSWRLQPWITKEIEFAVFLVAGTKLGMRQWEHYALVSQGECRTVSTWVLKDKKYLLKTLPQIKHNEAQDWSLGSSPVSYANTGYRCCSLQCLVLPVPAQQLKRRLARQICASLSCELLGLLVVNFYFCASFICGYHLVSLTPSAGQGTAGRHTARQSRFGILSRGSCVLHKWCWKSIPVGPHFLYVFPSNRAIEELIQHS